MAASPTTTGQTNLRLLLAEDNPVNQKVFLAQLKHLGYGADLANDGIEVLEALEHQTYDVILLDVQMPRLDGMETVHQIRQRYARDRPWVIAMTAHAMKGDAERCLAAGMNDYVSKPVKMAVLAEAFERYLQVAPQGP
jgi:CheY-like chemotaxis protein